MPSFTISIASGKGGTGKTSVAVSLAQTALRLGWSVQLLDCDVEEPNARLFFPRKVVKTQDVLGKVPTVNPDLCIGCKRCSQFCQFNAIVVTTKAQILEEFCHRCGGCSLICPTQAIVEKDRPIGKIIIEKYQELSIISGVLEIGQANPGVVIQEVKSFIRSDVVNIIDSAPGSGCAMMEAVENSNLCIGVVEATPFGLHDFQKAYLTLKKMGIPVAVIINRCDLGWDKVEKFCKDENIPILLKIPFLPEFQQAYALGKSLVEISSQWQSAFIQAMLKIKETIK